MERLKGLVVATSVDASNEHLEKLIKTQREALNQIDKKLYTVSNKIPEGVYEKVYDHSAWYYWTQVAVTIILSLLILGLAISTTYDFSSKKRINTNTTLTEIDNGMELLDIAVPSFSLDPSIPMDSFSIEAPYASSSFNESEWEWEWVSTKSASKKAKFQIAMIVLYLFALYLLDVECVLRMLGLKIVFFFMKRRRSELWNANRSGAYRFFASLRWTCIADLVILTICTIADTTFFILMLTIYTGSNTGTTSKNCDRECSMDRTVSLLGVFFPLRLLIFMSYHKKLNAIFRGIQNAIGTIVFMFFFLFISVYCFSSICFYFMQPNIKANCSKEGPGYNSDFCKLYFNNSFISFFTLFQLMTGDNWSDVVRGMAKNTSMGTFSYAFILFFICVTTFIILNIITGIVINAILAETHAMDTELEQERIQKELELQNQANQQQKDPQQAQPQSQTQQQLQQAQQLTRQNTDSQKITIQPVQTISLDSNNNTSTTDDKASLKDLEKLRKNLVGSLNVFKAVGTQMQREIQKLEKSLNSIDQSSTNDNSSSTNASTKPAS